MQSKGRNRRIVDQESRFVSPLLDAANMMGELMEYWGFKRIHGALWTLLFLSEEGLSQTDMVEGTGYSRGAISMALGELAEWGVVRVDHPLGTRERVYHPETDLGGMVKTVFMRREKILLQRAVEIFDGAAKMLGENYGSRFSWQQERLELLTRLSATALWTLEKFVRTGGLPFARLREFMEKGLARRILHSREH